MKRLLTALLTFIIFFTGTTISLAAFTDIPFSHENYIAINYLNKNGIVNGYADGSYKPGQLINRAESLKIILDGSWKNVPVSVNETGFTDVAVSDWFAPYVVEAKNIGIISGNPDGTFAPGRNVNRAEFLKMILLTNDFKKEKWEGLSMFSDIPDNEWYTPYMNYAGQAGLAIQDTAGNIHPSDNINRGEVAEIMYIMQVILSGEKTEFLLVEAGDQMSHVDIYMDANKPASAKRAAELSVDMTQQAYKNSPDNNVILGAAKLARAYDFLVEAYMANIDQNYTSSQEWATKAINKATEAWEVNSDTESTARHLKDRANAILSQIPA